MSSTTTTEAVSSTQSRALRSEDKILAAITAKEMHLLRARWQILLKPNQGAILGGRKLDNRGPLLRQISMFENKLKELKDELFKRRCLDAWVEGMWAQMPFEFEN